MDLRKIFDGVSLNPDTELSEENGIDFEYELMEWIKGGEYSCRPDYCYKNGIEVRVKDHEPNWANFIEDVELHGKTKFLNITVGDFEHGRFDESEKMTMDEFLDMYEGVSAISLFIYEGMTISDAKDYILHKCNEEGFQLF